MHRASPKSRKNPTHTPDIACIQQRAAYLRAIALRQCRTGVVPMPDDPALVRQWRLIKILSGNRFGASVQELAQEMKVAEKTIRRDLQTFEQVGFPLEQTEGEHGRKTWRMKAGHGQPELNFAFDEALALYLGRRFFEPLAGTHFWEAAQNAFKKIQACLGKQALSYMQTHGGRRLSNRDRRQRLHGQGRADRPVDAGHRRDEGHAHRLSDHADQLSQPIE